MSKIIEYITVYNTNIIDLIKIINNMINGGYQPYGNIFIENNLINNESCYHQPMVKYEEPEPRWKSWKRENELRKRGTKDIIYLDDINLKRTKSF